MARKKKTSYKDEPFEWASEKLQGSGNKPTVAPPPPTRKVSVSRQGNIRAGSNTGSSSRQRSHKRGPGNRGR